MKAVTFSEYGSAEVLKYTDVEMPVPQDNEVLIKIHAASVNTADWRIMRADPFPIRFVYGLISPKLSILGADVAGTVEAVGPDVKNFETGDAVFGDLSKSGWGGFSEYTCASEDYVVMKPKEVSFEDAAASGMAAVTALQGLKKLGGIKEGQSVLIVGASGSVGTFAVQIAKAEGADVTAVCSDKNTDQALALGADNVINYEKENFLSSGKTYDFILGINGSYTLKDYESVLNPDGHYVMVGGGNKHLFEVMTLGRIKSMLGKKKYTNVLALPNLADLTEIKNMLETGEIKPVIDRTYSLRDVAEAIRYVEKGHATGKVIIKEMR